MLYGNNSCHKVTYHIYHFMLYGKLPQNKSILYDNLPYDIFLLYGNLPYGMKSYHISFYKYVCKGYE